MFGAGPFWEDNEIDWNGEGMVIIRANSIDHAKVIIKLKSSGIKMNTNNGNNKTKVQTDLKLKFSMLIFFKIKSFIIFSHLLSIF